MISGGGSLPHNVPHFADPHSKPLGGGGVNGAPDLGVGRLQTPDRGGRGLARGESAPPNQLFRPHPADSPWPPPRPSLGVRPDPQTPFLRHFRPRSSGLHRQSPPPRHPSDSRMGARPTRKGLGEGAPLVSTCDGEVNFSFTRCLGNAGGGDEWAGRGARRGNQLRRCPCGVPASPRTASEVPSPRAPLAESRLSH